MKYDFLNRRASAYMKQGYDEGKTFLRRYDNKSEFMIRGPPYPECVRSYLGERMPPPVFPDPFELVRSDDIDGAACEHWVDDLGVNRVHLWMCPALPGSGLVRYRTGRSCLFATVHICSYAIMIV